MERSTPPPPVTDTCNGNVADGQCQRRAGEGTTHLGYGRCSHHAGSTPTGAGSALVALLDEIISNAEPGDDVGAEFLRRAGFGLPSTSARPAQPVDPMD